MSTMKIQDLNYDESTTMTLEPSEAGSVYGGVFLPDGGFERVNPILGGVFLPDGGFERVNPILGGIFLPDGGFERVNPVLGGALAES